ncbi:MAG: type I-C CRISPR-associated protein Cas8c/Csd1 [Kiritimatiellia bacterium]
MILKALADYYQRLADDPNVDIAPPGFEYKSIDFLVVLDGKGCFEELRDMREGTGKKRKGPPRLVPKSVKRASNVAANLLWDTAAYVFGINPAKPDRGEKQRAAFTERIEQTFEGNSDAGVGAVLAFLKQGDFMPVFDHSVWPEAEQSGGNISFVLTGEAEPICQRPEVVATIQEKAKPEGRKQTCSLSGRKDVPAELHTAIKGVWGAQSSGANIVSFNLDAFRSFGKRQGHNASVGQAVEFTYTTALNYLLASENQRMQVGDASTVFWAKDPCDFESDFHSFLAPKKGEEAVSYEKIKALLSAVKTGIPAEESHLPFYVLGLSPNASRIAVRFWYNGNVKEIKERVAKHFEDIGIIRAPHDPEFLSLFQLLVSTATEQKADNIQPKLGGEVGRAILAETRYPRTLLANAMRRCKSEQRVPFARASIIKGVLARNARLAKSGEKEVGMSLDKEYDNIGYVLGRLFAMLERIQEQAQGQNLNKTIRDTYFGGAASSPQVVFKRLLDLSVHHLAKIRNSGKSAVWMEKELGAIMALMPQEGAPATLDLEDQGRFAVGYYHQRQDFFTKRETVQTEEENTNE